MQKNLRLVFAGLVLLLVLISFLSVSKTIAEEEGAEFGEGEDDFFKGLGVFAAAFGFLLNALYVFQKEMRKHGIQLPFKPSLALNLHIAFNIILGVVGIIHGYALRGYAGLVEYLLVGFIVFTIVSGLVLRYFKFRHVKFFARLIHTQRLLSLILLILLGIHVASVED